MRLKEIIHRVRHGRASAVDRPARNIALVIAEPEVAAALHELYQAYGYEVFLPDTPLDVIETLAVVVVDIERIGDLAVNAARRAHELNRIRVPAWRTAASLERRMQPSKT